MKPILVVTYWSFKDALVQTYTLPYVKIIANTSKRKVYIVCLEQAQLATTKQERSEINKGLQNENIEIIFFDYHRFGIKQTLMWGVYLSRLWLFILKNRIEYIHTWGTPAGAIGYILSLFSGKCLILDSYEPHAEAMVENGTWKRNSLAFKILFFLEKKQSQKARFFIAAASGMKTYAKHAYHIDITANHFFVKPACTDLQQFKPRKKDTGLLNELGLMDKIVCVYAGKLGGIYLNDEIFDFFKQCYSYWGDKFNIVMLTNASEDSIIQQLKRVGIPQERITHQFVLHHDIPRYLSLGDFALNPVKPVPTKRYCTSIKDGEYWAMGLPVVITSGISDDSEIIEKNNAGYVLKNLSIDEYINAIRKIEGLLSDDSDLKGKIRLLAKKHRSFDIANNTYRSIYNNCINSTSKI